jgi:hypothetical protein
MTPETALDLQKRIGREIKGLEKALEQLAQPDTATTPGGLKSGIVILARSLLRTNQIALDITRAEVEPPSPHNLFGRLFR